MTDEIKQPEIPATVPATVPPKPLGPIAKLKRYINDPDIQKRLGEILGKRSGAFANSIVNVVKNNKNLQNCEIESVMSAAMIAATMNLPIDPALGYAAIIPYGNVAQFQLMYKGIIQLCIRSGQYARIHNTEVYRDEIKSYDPITGQIKFNKADTYKMRNEKKVADVAGFYSEFKLRSGFHCSNYWTMEEVMAHAKRFSKAYQYDLEKNKKVSLWSLDPVSMGKKTSLKMLLTKYGIMSIEMQDAFVAEADDFVDAVILEAGEGEIKLGKEAVKDKIKKRGRPAKQVENTEIPLIETPDPEFIKKQAEQLAKLNAADAAKKSPTFCGYCVTERQENDIEEIDGKRCCTECGTELA